MISRILKSTQGKPCSCPAGKICEGCKKKTTVKPQVYIEEPRRLTVPIVIKRHRKPSTTVQIIEKPRRWVRKKESPVKQATFCSWYKKRKAFYELKREYQREKRRDKEERLERARRERELEVLEQLQTLARLQATETSNKRAHTPIVKSPVPVKEHRVRKEKRVKTRTTAAKPRADSKYVSVKRYNRYDSWSNRFVNCCYRICCQFYCYMSCVFIIGFVIIYFL